MSKPFLKWAGGKYTQLADLFVHIPAGKRLIEPFVGGGAVFLNSDKHADYLLADVNPDLINLYQMLAVVPDEVELKARWKFEHMRSSDGYELIRSEFNAQTLDATERAAAFLYLNRHCFNGLMRYNQANKFNVGWGGYKAPYYPMDEMKAFAAMAH
ncbi:Dam family site-specific DNA-(adenine-N6)-methyltransferase, partial [Klebsiella pneumoniae]|uniref:Dam family site-specific DNA-(adenine-N6)-methyltransferase n=3 Tax=Klebsiella TaxID=570 RepID=UPI00349F277B